MILGHLKVRDLKRMTADERLRVVARELRRMAPQKRKRVARELFGPAGASMVLAMAEA